MKQSKWEWYGVKILYECIISGEPSVIDENYTDYYKTYEESIIVVRAQSFAQAYKIAERKAIKEEHSYLNTYDQLVEWKYVDAIDCFNLFDDPIKPGSEVYSRFLRVPATIPTKEVIDNFYPETIEEDDDTPDYSFKLRYKKFNARPGSQ